MAGILLKAAALWMSILGYCCYIRKKGVDMAFAPVITLAFLGSLLLLAGILNVLPLAVGALWLGGILCGILARPGRLEKYDYFCLLVFCGITALFALRIHDQIPIHYDSFSHWLTVVREMLNTDQLPNFQSKLIIFQGYPTGIAGLAYYVCKFVGSYGDDVILFAQALPIAAGLCIFLAFAGRLKPAKVAVMGLGSIYCLVTNSGADTAICTPLPDTLLSVLTIASLAIVVYYRKDPVKAAWAGMPVQVFLVAVKNSGLFLMVFASVLLVYYAARREKAGRLVRLGGIHLGIPLGVFYLWSRHVAYVFPNGTTSKHMVSLDNFQKVLEGKSPEQCREIMDNFLERVLTQTSTWLLLGLIGGILLTGYLLRRRLLGEKRPVELGMFAGLLGAYLLFMAGLLGMYLLSMPYGEAVGLAGYTRYEKTMLICLVGAAVLYALWLLDRLPGGGSGGKWVLVLLMAAILSTQSTRVGKLFVPANPYEGSSRQFLEEARNTYGISEGASCLIYGPQIENDSGYHYVLGRYVFWTTRLEVCTPEKLAEQGALPEGYQYLIVMESDAALDTILRDAGFEPGQTVYKLHE